MHSYQSADGLLSVVFENFPEEGRQGFESSGAGREHFRLARLRVKVTLSVSVRVTVDSGSGSGGGKSTIVDQLGLELRTIEGGEGAQPSVESHILLRGYIIEARSQLRTHLPQKCSP